jgi:hypothetical protein
MTASTTIRKLIAIVGIVILFALSSSTTFAHPTDGSGTLSGRSTRDQHCVAFHLTLSTGEVFKVCVDPTKDRQWNQPHIQNGAVTYEFNVSNNPKIIGLTQNVNGKRYNYSARITK